MTASRKKVIVRKSSRDWVAGYLPPANFVLQGELHLLDLEGKVLPIRLAEVKWVCFVREFSSGDPGQPERLLSRSFARRPRSQGLWMRARLKDGDVIEGLAQNDASLLDGDGVFLIPPDGRSNTQRIFLPKAAIQELEILAVVRSGAPKTPPEILQGILFKPQS